MLLHVEAMFVYKYVFLLTIREETVQKNSMIYSISPSFHATTNIQILNAFYIMRHISLEIKMIDQFKH